jgi:hypothetical protein
MRTFTAQYEVGDGYCGGSRPQTFKIHYSDIDEDMTQQDIKELYHDMIQNDFEENIFPEAEKVDEFVKWAMTSGSKNEDCSQ